MSQLVYVSICLSPFILVLFQSFRRLEFDVPVFDLPLEAFIHVTLYGVTAPSSDDKGAARCLYQVNIPIFTQKRLLFLFLVAGQLIESVCLFSASVKSMLSMVRSKHNLKKVLLRCIAVLQFFAVYKYSHPRTLYRHLCLLFHQSSQERPPIFRYVEDDGAKYKSGGRISPPPVFR